MARKVDPAAQRMREWLLRLLLCLLAGVGLSVYVSRPAWSGVGIAAVLMAGSLLSILPLGFLVAKMKASARLTTVALAAGEAVFELARLGLLAWAGAGAAEAAWAGLWSAALLAALLLAMMSLRRLLKPDEPGRAADSPGHVLAPRQLVVQVGMIARDIGACLLVVWSPWLVLATFATGTGSVLLREQPIGRTWVQTISGYVLLVVALVLWLR
ncbi:hypothetical protein [Nonomuraea sp. CA-141351]|uniref:hypothetical protein n=1 Tax=Nonomuraea sp. CA-141351 TaxID=3239996 RepID=UPI003D8CF57F